MNTAKTAFMTLGTSLINNVAVAFIERAAIKRYPTHRKLTRALGWTERIAFASYLAYYQSAAIFANGSGTLTWRVNWGTDVTRP